MVKRELFLFSFSFVLLAFRVVRNSEKQAILVQEGARSEEDIFILAGRYFFVWGGNKKKFSRKFGSCCANCSNKTQKSH